MSKGGKHLNKSGRSYGRSNSRYKGKHLSEKYTSKPQRSYERSSRNYSRLPAVAPLSLVMIVFCFIMISPIKGCMLSDDSYIGFAAAQNIALDASGISANNTKSISSDIIIIDGNAYYKVQLTNSNTDCRYIIDAVNGDIVMQNFYNLDNSE